MDQTKLKFTKEDDAVDERQDKFRSLQTRD